MGDVVVGETHAVGDAFRVEVSRQGESVVASVFGEIDLATAPALVTAVEGALATSPATERVVVDLTEVTFLDSSGLNALVRLEKQLAERSVQLRIVSPSDRIVRYVFDLTDLAEPLHVVGSLDEALL